MGVFLLMDVGVRRIVINYVFMGARRHLKLEKNAFPVKMHYFISQAGPGVKSGNPAATIPHDKEER